MRVVNVLDSGHEQVTRLARAGRATVKHRGTPHKPQSALVRRVMPASANITGVWNCSPSTQQNIANEPWEQPQLTTIQDHITLLYKPATSATRAQLPERGDLVTFPKAISSDPQPSPQRIEELKHAQIGTHEHNGKVLSALINQSESWAQYPNLVAAIKARIHQPWAIIGSRSKVSEGLGLEP